MLNKLCISNKSNLQLCTFFYTHAAIKERALAKHKSSATHVSLAASKHSQVSQESPSLVQKSDPNINGKQWEAVYADSKGLDRSHDRKAPLISTATLRSPHSTSTTMVTFPGFANLGITKDQALTKNKEAVQDDSPPPVMPVHANGGREQNNRIGYLMPDEELLRKWTNSKT